jgi:hypothetical protein
LFDHERFAFVAINVNITRIKVRQKMAIWRYLSPGYCVFETIRPIIRQLPTDGRYIALSARTMPEGIMLDTGKRAAKNHKTEKITSFNVGFNFPLTASREATKKTDMGNNTLKENKDKSGFMIYSSLRLTGKTAKRMYS